MRYGLAGGACVLWLAMAHSAGAQETFTYKTETHLIDSTVSVHDAQGGLVQGLTAEDFRIVEDGVPQTVRFFAHDKDLPLSIGLLIDASGSQEKFVKAHEHDIATFLHEVVEPGDEAFAVCFGNHLRLISDYTSQTQNIADALVRFDRNSRDFPELGPIEERDLGTALYDAIYFGVRDRLSERQGRRKVLLVLSDGEENSSEHDLIDAIEMAQNSNVLIYSVRYTDLHQGQMNARDRYGMRALNHLSDETGGRSYDVQTTTMDKAFAEIAGEIRALYSVAYQSTNRVRDGSFRKVQILPAREGLVFRSRSGYYAGNAVSKER
jgi:Ca-activated chloride channel family protein